MIGDAIEAERVVQAARFAPHGSRVASACCTRDQLAAGVGEAMRAAEDATLVILQIETEAGVEHVEEIAVDARGRRPLGRAVRPVDRAWASPGRSTTRG